MRLSSDSAAPDRPDTEALGSGDASPVPPAPSRLNPFAFVSDTTLRFALLILFAANATAVYWVSIAVNWSHLGFGGRTIDVETELLACLREEPLSGSVMFEAAHVHVWQTCLRPSVQYVAGFVVFGLAVLAIATCGLYALRPKWIQYAWRASSIKGQGASEIVRRLQNLVAQAGLNREPLFSWNLLAGVPEARIFGAFGRNRVIILGGVLGLLITKPQNARAVLLHEFAHVRNGDVAKVELAEALWAAVCVTVFPPFLATTVAQGFRPGDDLYDGLRLLAFMLLVWLMRNSVLRTRELYADAQVSRMEPEGLLHVLRSMQDPGRWWQFVSAHPRPARRIALLTKTDELFDLGSWDALGLGAASGISGLLISVIMSSWVTGRLGGDNLDSTTRFVVPIVSFLALFLLFGVAPIAVATWRAGFHALMHHRRIRGLIRIPLAFSAGVNFGTGGLVLFLMIVTVSDHALPSAVPLTLLPWLLVLIPAAWLVLGLMVTFCLCWVAACATAWLPLLVRCRRPGAIPVLTVVLACLGYILIPIYVGSALFIPAADPDDSLLFASIWHLALLGTTFPVNLLASAAVIMFWAWPLAPALLVRCKHDLSIKPWPWLEPALPYNAPPLASLYLRRSLIIGLAAGLAGGLLLARFGEALPNAWFPGLQGHGAAIAPQARMMLASILAQMVIAALTVIAVPRLGPVLAVFACNAAGLIMVIAMWLHLGTYGAAVRPGLAFTAHFLLQPVLLGGAVIAAVTGSLIWPAARWVRSREWLVF